MTDNTILGLSPEEIRSLSIEDLIIKLTPLIEGTLNKAKISGAEREDIKQELLLVLWKCQRSYFPDIKTGFEGRKSSFYTYLVNSFSNKLSHIRENTNKETKYSLYLKCKSCGALGLGRARTKCACGNRTWDTTSLTTYRSIDSAGLSGLFLMLQDMSNDYAAVEEKDYIRYIINNLPKNLQESARKIFNDGILTTTEKKKLKQWISENPQYIRTINKGE